MKQIRNFFKDLNFSYLKTFSAFRGDKFQNIKKDIENEILSLENKIAKSRFMEKLKIEKEISALQKEKNKDGSNIIDSSNKIHRSAEEIFHQDEKGNFTKRLREIIMQSKRQEAFSACIPIYRDALVFYSARDEINGILQICFECAQIVDEYGYSYEMDFGSYQELKKLLIECGHQIE